MLWRCSPHPLPPKWKKKWARGYIIADNEVEELVCKKDATGMLTEQWRRLQLLGKMFWYKWTWEYLTFESGILQNSAGNGSKQYQGSYHKKVTRCMFNVNIKFVINLTCYMVHLLVLLRRRHLAKVFNMKRYTMHVCNPDLKMNSQVCSLEEDEVGVMRTSCYLLSITMYCQFYGYLYCTKKTPSV